MSGYFWFLLFSIAAGISVGLSTQSVAYGSSAFVCLLALRNAVMFGYIEGRTRYECDNERSPLR